MGELLSYSIVSGLAMLALYLVYRILLARDYQHNFNRAILLLIYFVSFVLSPYYLISGNIIGEPDPQIFSFNVTGEANASLPTKSSTSLLGTILIWIYLSGMLAVIAKTVFTWFRLIKLIRSGKKIAYGDFILVITDYDRYAPFSWRHYIVISRSDYDSNYSMIAEHELKHIICHHWIDLLIAQIVCIINWFNPAAWLMRDELILVHEYQADMAVIDSGHDAQEYQMLLIKKAVGSKFPSLANSLNHSKLNKRITMMYKSKSGTWRKFKALVLVPVLILVLGVTSIHAVRAAVSTISNSGITTYNDRDIISESNVTVRVLKVIGISNDGNKTTVIIKGENLGNSITVSGGTFTNNGTDYNASSLLYNMTDGKALITAVFPFSADFKNPSMTLVIDGDEIPFVLENFCRSSQAQLPTTSSTPAKVHAVKVVEKESSTTFDDMNFYLDGKKISGSELKEISPETIKEITVDKRNNAIRISSK